MTNYIRTNQEPPKEQIILLEDGRFSQNWKVAYSNYLTQLYGFENQYEYEKYCKKIIPAWNRVAGRVKEDKKMTDKNLIIIQDIQKMFPEYNINL